MARVVKLVDALQLILVLKAALSGVEVDNVQSLLISASLQRLDARL